MKQKTWGWIGVATWLAAALLAIAINANAATQVFSGNVSGNATTVTNLTITSATEVGQAWITPAFNAGDFTGSESMTVTVGAGDVVTFAYIITGKMMTVSFNIFGITIGGTPSTTVNIAIPAGKTATKAMQNSCTILPDVTGVGGGQVRCSSWSDHNYRKAYK